MKLSRIAIASSIGAACMLLGPLAALASTAPLTASCSGSPTTTNIMWSASSSGGVTPVAFLWGNGATSTMQTLAEGPGTYSMPLQATDASSTVATTSCSATVASSTSSGGNSSIYAQIQALIAEINALKLQIQQLAGGLTSGGSTGTTTPTTVGTHGCPMPNRDLGEGSRGSDVLQLQQYLADNDSDFASSSVTGFFGPLTARAVARFQFDNGIASSTTGFVGPITRGFFGKHCGEIGGVGHQNVPPPHTWVNGSTTPYTWPTASTTFPTLPNFHGFGSFGNEGHSNGSSTGDNGSDH